MNKKIRELKMIDEWLEKSFEEKIIEILESAEEESYNPYETRSKTTIQKSHIKYFINNYEKIMNKITRRSIELTREIKKEKQELENMLKEIKEAEFIETPQSVVSKQIRKNYIFIEKHYKKNDEYDVFDWLADADPENHLEFL